MKLQNMIQKNEKGFTLVELLIVIAIIGILAAIAIPQFSQYRKRAWATELNTDLKNAYTAAQVFLTDNPAGSVSAIGDLTASGYRSSTNITLTGTGMAVNSGSIVLSTSADITAPTGTVTFDGTFTMASP